MTKEPKIKYKYDYVFIKESSFHFNKTSLELQNKGYEPQGLPVINIDKNGFEYISLMFRKLIYEAEYTKSGELIREYNYN